jgi:hypothetical protein
MSPWLIAVVTAAAIVIFVGALYVIGRYRLQRKVSAKPNQIDPEGANTSPFIGAQLRGISWARSFDTSSSDYLEPTPVIDRPYGTVICPPVPKRLSHPEPLESVYLEPQPASPEKPYEMARQEQTYAIASQEQPYAMARQEQTYAIASQEQTYAMASQEQTYAMAGSNTSPTKSDGTNDSGVSSLDSPEKTEQLYDNQGVNYDDDSGDDTYDSLTFMAPQTHQLSETDADNVTTLPGFFNQKKTHTPRVTPATTGMKLG